ncbi:MAG TPA: hypothetical protein PLO31_06155, partial [Dysgonamonadaceae bacterium]|nr:hypothetical protein [Dysgonamonadaceae bacterium]
MILRNHTCFSSHQIRQPVLIYMVMFIGIGAILCNCLQLSANTANTHVQHILKDSWNVQPKQNQVDEIQMDQLIAGWLKAEREQYAKTEK